MKKYYLPFMCLGLFSSVVFSQNTYVTGPAKVKVQPNTLFYNGGNFHIKSAASSQETIKNDGNIKINGSFVNDVDGGKNFISTYTNANSYGQVIINDDNATAISGNKNRLAMEKNKINPANNPWGQFAVPYVYSSAGDIIGNLFNGTTYQGGGRYDHSIMKWDNLSKPEFDQVPAAIQVLPTDYVIINLTNHTELRNIMNGTGNLIYPGVPANQTHTVNFSITSYPDLPWNTWKMYGNSHGEAYVSYIEEAVRQTSEDNYGKYLYQFGNPYTSNIDLSNIGTNSDIDGVYIENLSNVFKVGNLSWDSGAGTVIDQSTITVATWNGTRWAGNSNALIVKPFESFVIGLNDDVNRSNAMRSFTFNDGLKTFLYEPKNPGDATPGGTPKTGNISNEGIYETNSVDGVLSNGFYQLGLSLYNEADQRTGNQVYVVIDPDTETGVSQPLESDYSDFIKGFYLTQENADGSEVIQPNRTMQINAVNPTYVSKPIPMFYKQPTSDLNGYYLKAELYYNNIFNKLSPEEEVNFPDGNSFFFYDKVQDILLPVNSDFSYYIDRPESSLESRYVIYWNGGPQNEDGGLGVSDELAGKTQVYKDGELHKIRFDKNWNTAAIAVYDMAGRSIFKKENVKTDVDFTLDLPNTMVYVVKIQSNTGETVTEKILR